MDCKFFVERLAEFLREVHEQVKHVVLLIRQQNALLKVSLASLQALQRSVVVLGDLQQLLEENDNQFDHLFVFLAAFWLLKDLVHVHYESFNDFWRQEVLLVDVKLSEEINLDATLAVFVRQLSELAEQHEAQKAHLLILVMENVQRQQVFLKEVPFAECLPYERLTLPIELDLLEKLLKTLFTVLVLHVDVEATDLLNAADTLDPKEKLSLFL